MTGRDEADTGGDYEYDLAHDDVTGAEAPARREPEAAQPQVPQDDTGGDYSYDLAHDVPPAGS